MNSNTKPAIPSQNTSRPRHPLSIVKSIFIGFLQLVQRAGAAMGALDASTASGLVPVASDKPRPASLATARILAVVLLAGFGHIRPVFSGLEI